MSAGGEPNTALLLSDVRAGAVSLPFLCHWKVH